MPDSISRPINWADYEQGRSSPRQGSVGSLGSHVQFDTPSPVGSPDRLRIPGATDPEGQTLKHRRSVHEVPLGGEPIALGFRLT